MPERSCVFHASAKPMKMKMQRSDAMANMAKYFRRLIQWPSNSAPALAISQAERTAAVMFSTSLGWSISTCIQFFRLVSRFEVPFQVRALATDHSCASKKALCAYCINYVYNIYTYTHAVQFLTWRTTFWICRAHRWDNLASTGTSCTLPIYINV